MSQVHARARTTPLIRTEIRESELGVVALAEHYNITRGTASKWKNREDVQDRSHRPHKLSTTLSEGQEALVAEVRRLTLIPLDDLLVVVREFINPAVSRSGAGPVSVEDTGIGIAPAQLPRLFEPFFRAGAAGAPPPARGSNGLGLAIAKSLMEAMDGGIGVSSEPGRGSVFTLTLKRVVNAEREAAEPAAPLPAVSGAGRPRTRILYMEDNEVNRLLVEGFVAKRPDLAVVSCVDGATGLDAARRLLPDIVLIDIDLPDMSGHEVLRAILAEPQLSRACGVAFSANGGATDIEAAIRSGFLEYLRKPISAEDFLAAIDRLIAVHHITQDSRARQPLGCARLPDPGSVRKQDGHR